VCRFVAHDALRRISGRTRPSLPQGFGVLQTAEKKAAEKKAAEKKAAAKKKEEAAEAALKQQEAAAALKKAIAEKQPAEAAAAKKKEEAAAALKKEEAAALTKAAAEKEAEAVAKKENEAAAAEKRAVEAAADVAKKKAVEAVRSLLCTKHVCAKLSVCAAQCAVVGSGVESQQCVAVAPRPRLRCILLRWCCAALQMSHGAVLCCILHAALRQFMRLHAALVALVPAFKLTRVCKRPCTCRAHVA
jgi:hypothetical protein